MIRFGGAGLLAIATAIALPAAAQAQTAPAEATADAPKGGDIIVTANKRAERIVDVASAVTAVSGEELLTRNLPQIEDFANQVPGLAVQQFGNRATRIVLRGLNSGGAGSTVATVLDEAPLSYSNATSNGAIDIANFDTYDLNRIEVLRGPQGTLYGATAEGGIIKYVTNAPDLNDYSAGAEGIAESTNEGGNGYTGRAVVNLPLVTDKLALRATGFYKEVQGYIDNTRLGVKDANKGRRYGGRAQLLFQPSDGFSIKLGALIQDQHFDDGGNLEVVGTPLTPYVGPTATRGGSRTPDSAFAIANNGRLQNDNYRLSPSDNRTYLFTSVINASLGFADLLSATSYGAVKSTFSNDTTSAVAAPGFTFGDFFAGFFGRRITIAGRQDNNLAKFNQELRLSSKPGFAIGGLKLDWQAGAFYTHEDIDFNQFYDFVETNGTVITQPLIPGGSILPANYSEFAAFGTVKLHLNDRFNVEVGGRYSWNWQDVTVTNFAGFLTGPTDTLNPTRRTKESKFIWSVAPQFRINDDTTLYARVATGFRPGGPTLAVPGVPAGVLPEKYLSDSTTNYEIGFKGSLFDKKLSIDLAAFYIDWKDIQIITLVSTPAGPYAITGNAGKARSKGIEWNVAFTPFRGFTISDVGAYTNARLTTDALALGARKDWRLTYVPNFTNTVNVDYKTSIGDRTSAFIGASWAYTGTRRTTYSAAATGYGYALLPSYDAISAQAGIEYHNLRTEIFVRNLTDERALTTYGSSGGADLTGQAQILQPRTIGVKFAIKY
jgi:outer membrane receptor protein involved in Fe transport